MESFTTDAHRMNQSTRLEFGGQGAILVESYGQPDPDLDFHTMRPLITARALAEAVSKFREFTGREPHWERVQIQCHHTSSQVILELYENVEVM